MKPRKVPALSVSGDSLSVNGQQCLHASGDGMRDVCLVLKHFGLLDEVIGDENVVFCPEHVSVIPLDTLASHLSSKHRNQCNSMLGKSIGRKGNPDTLLSPLVGHIAETLDIHPKQSLNDILNLELAQPMAHGVPEPRRSVQCPNCKTWFFCKEHGSEFKNLRDHIYYQKKAEPCKEVYEAGLPDIENHLTVRFTQPLFKYRGGRCNPKVPLQEGWTPESAQGPSTSTAMPSQGSQVEQPDNDEDFDMHNEPVAEWLNTVGWPEWLESCRTDGGKDVELDAKDILRFIALPSQRISTSLPETEQAIENGLKVVYQFTRDYLQDANAFIRTQHIQVRHSVTEG
jgi:hypothetical protein